MDRIRLNDAYRRADLACAKVHYRLDGSHMYENETLLHTDEMRAELESQLSAACAEVAALPAPEEVHRLLKQHFNDFLDGEARNLQGFFDRPAGGIGRLARKIQFCIDGDTRPAEEKVPVLLGQLDRAETFIAHIGRQLPDGVPVWTVDTALDNIRHYRDNMKVYMPDVPDALAEELTRKIDRACEMIAGMPVAQHTTGAPDDEGKCVPFTEEYYRSVLHDTLGVELDELLKWHAEEIEKTRAAVFGIASKLPVPEKASTMREVNAILNKYAGAYDTLEEMFRRMDGYLKRAQAAAREYVWFPEEVCRLEKVPYPIRESFPWGGYSDGDGRLRPITGKVFLNNINFRAVTDGWMKMQAIHESYPGHHIQYVRNVTDTLPETLKLGAKHIPLIEGVAHRSEHVFEFVFEEDPFYPLFVAYRRHHTAVRIKSDLMLRYHGRPIADCVKLYMDELDFDHRTARGQVLAQEQMEGDFNCYYYGMKKISDYEARYGKDEKSFTETLFSCGNMSMENLEGYLKLDAAGQKSWRTDFCSLLMDPQDVIRYRR